MHCHSLGTTALIQIFDKEFKVTVEQQKPAPSVPAAKDTHNERRYPNPKAHHGRLAQRGFTAPGRAADVKS